MARKYQQRSPLIKKLVNRICPALTPLQLYRSIQPLWQERAFSKLSKINEDFVPIPKANNEITEEGGPRLPNPSEVFTCKKSKRAVGCFTTSSVRGGIGKETQNSSLTENISAVSTLSSSQLKISCFSTKPSSSGKPGLSHWEGQGLRPTHYPCLK